MRILLIGIPLLCGCSLFALPEEIRGLKLANKGFAATLVGLEAKVESGEITPAEAQLAAMAAATKRDEELEAAATRTDGQIDAALEELKAGSMTLEKALGGSGAMTGIGLAALHFLRNRTRKKALNGSAKT